MRTIKNTPSEIAGEMQTSDFEKRVNGKLRALGAMIGAVCCFLVDDDLATPAELEALTKSVLKYTDSSGEFDMEKFFEDLQTEA